MPLTPAQLLELKTEITNDPNGYGLNFTDPVGTAALLNEIRAAITVNVDVLQVDDLKGALNYAEVGALATAEFQALTVLLSGTQVDPQDSKIVAAFAEIFGSGTDSRANLNALRTRDGSRAEELFGIGTVVTHSDVANSETA